MVSSRKCISKRAGINAKVVKKASVFEKGGFRSGKSLLEIHRIKNRLENDVN
jgi:hypothetical protein